MGGIQADFPRGIEKSGWRKISAPHGKLRPPEPLLSPDPQFLEAVSQSKSIENPKVMHQR